MSSDFFLLGNPSLPGLKDLNLLPAKKVSKTQSKVFLILMSKSNLKHLLEAKIEDAPHKVFIYLKETSDKMDLWCSIFNKFPPSLIVEPKQIDLELLNQALNQAREKEQLISLQKMRKEKKLESAHEKQEKLKNLQDLKKRLERSNKRLLGLKKLEQLNLRVLESIFNAASLAVIEEETSEILARHLNLKWMRILMNPGEIISELPAIKYQKHFKTKIFDLGLEKKKSGKIIFAFSKNSRLTKTKLNLLRDICDAVSLKVQQMITESEIETSQKQWEITFKSLPFKAAIIDKNYRVLQTGGQFKKHEASADPLCYRKFFKRDQPCEGCKLGENFLIEQNNESLEVNSKEVFDSFSEDYYFLNFYRDFDVSTLNESERATKTKLEELGVISGSIAHELNNPLGGIKILLELLKEEEEMETPEALEDLSILESSSKKCIEIVSELLDFTRKNESRPPLSLSQYFEKLKTFTGAYLLSQGLILHIPSLPAHDQMIDSKDASLLIKLLEGVAQFAKNLHPRLDQEENIPIYVFSPENSEQQLVVQFSELPPREASTTQSVSPSKTLILSTSQALGVESFEEKGGQSLTLKFSTEVKPIETLV